jgi:hypothetical protein
MSKFVVVKEAPKDLQKGEYLIDTPSFLAQIAQHRAKKPRNGLTERMYLDAIMNSIGEAYDAGNTDPHSNRVKYHNYVGILAPQDQDVNEVILRAIRLDCSQLLSKYLDTKIRTRPAGTEKVIYVNSNINNQYEIFHRNGLSEEKAEAPEKKKSDKVVGKPAVTKEEAEAKKNQADS